jgi:hypothetical protein
MNESETEQERKVREYWTKATENQDIFQYVNVLSEAIPYVATSLRIVRLERTVLFER